MWRGALRSCATPSPDVNAPPVIRKFYLTRVMFVRLRKTYYLAAVYHVVINNIRYSNVFRLLSNHEHYDKGIQYNYAYNLQLTDVKMIRVPSPDISNGEDTVLRHKLCMCLQKTKMV